uniref:Uncharacterized protein n=2 Tax=Micrurus TaxID=8634 RepID=A0A2D4N1I6_9SAUR
MLQRKALPLQRTMNWKSSIQKIRMNISCVKAHLVSRCLAMTDHPMLLTYHGHLRFCIVQPHPPQSHIITGFFTDKRPPVVSVCCAEPTGSPELHGKNRPQ